MFEKQSHFLVLGIGGDVVRERSMHAVQTIVSCVVDLNEPKHAIFACDVGDVHIIDNLSVRKHDCFQEGCNPMDLCSQLQPAAEFLMPWPVNCLAVTATIINVA